MIGELPIFLITPPPFAFLLLGVLLASKALGQGEVQNFYLKDGTSIQGKIVAQDDSTLLVETEYGTIEIRRVEILKHEKTKQLAIKPQNEKIQTEYDIIIQCYTIKTKQRRDKINDILQQL